MRHYLGRSPRGSLLAFGPYEIVRVSQLWKADILVLAEALSGAGAHDQVCRVRSQDQRALVAFHGIWLARNVRSPA